MTGLPCQVDNYSSFTNDSLTDHQFPSSNVSQYDSLCAGALYKDTVLTLVAVVLVVPVSVFVLYLGFQRWKQQRATAAVIPHSDFFTYNMAVIELIGVLMDTIRIYGAYTRLHKIIKVVYFMESFIWAGQMFFPVLTCVDRYLAVVHPLTYLRLRQRGGVRIRNISAALVWLQGCAGPVTVVLLQNYSEYLFIPSVLHLFFFLVIMVFCSVSVLCALIRPRPGAPGKDRVHIHQSKQRALCTITIIMGVLLLKFGANLVQNVLLSSPAVSYSVMCEVGAARGWLELPSSLMLPLLFLHRAGKLAGCERNTASE